MILEKHISELKASGFRYFGDERGHKLSIDFFVILAYQKYSFEENYYNVHCDVDKELAMLQLETLDGFSYIFKFTKS